MVRRDSIDIEVQALTIKIFYLCKGVTLLSRTCLQTSEYYTMVISDMTLDCESQIPTKENLSDIR